MRSPRASLLAAVLASGCLHARGTATDPVVTGLELEGVRSVDEAALRERLATRGSDRFAWGDARRLDPDALGEDVKRIQAFYKERGWYRTTVESPEVRPDGEGRVKIVLRVREGAPVRVASVKVEGLEGAPEARARAGALELEAGQVFAWAAYDASRARLLTALGETGYAAATVKQEARVRANEGTAEVTYRVEPGMRYRFGPVTVTGTVAVPEEKVAARAARLVRPGDWYDERLLDRMQSRVFELGVFAGVRVNRGTPDPAQGVVPIEVAVREAPFRTVRTGPGFGFESTRWELLGQASWTHRNWLGDLRQLTLDARGGYAWLPNPFSPYREGAVGKAAAGFSQPGILGDAVDFTTSVEVEKTLEQAYDSISEKFRIGTPIRPAPRWMFAPSYNLEVYQLRDVAGAGGRPLEEVQTCPDELCILSYLEQRVSWDGRDHPVFTTDGLFVSVALQEGFPAGGLGYTFLKFSPDVRWYHPLGRGAVLAVRARFGAFVPIHEKESAPIVALFMAGGAGSMRGYGADRLSPMVQDEEGDWLATGGNGVAEGSVEVRKTLAGSLVGAVYLDAGNVSGASGVPNEFLTALDPSLLQYAIGVGVRYRTPVGPFRADVAFRLPSDLRPGVPFQERFPPVPGDSGHREPIVAIHVALGEAF